LLFLFFVFIATIIIVVVHTLFKNINTNSLKKTTSNLKNKENYQSVMPTDNLYNVDNLNSRESTFSSIDGFNLEDNKLIKESCPIHQNERDTRIFLTDHLFSDNKKCKIKKNDRIKSRKNFHSDFFSFRDQTYNNSSQRLDPVDKISSLYLSGNFSQARRYPNMKIKDLFDEVTKGPNLYTRQCVRLPQFDNILAPGSPGLSLTRNEWKYDNI
jgi:hypothetical protein